MKYSFKVLRYLYIDDVQLTPKNAADIMLLAHFYNLKSLEDICTTFMMRLLSLETACTMYCKVHLLTKNEFAISCRKFISAHITQLLFGDEHNILDIDNEVLDDVFDVFSLDIDAVKLFEEVLMWAGRQCGKMDRKPTGAKLRKTIGGRLNIVRFSRMTSEEFTTCLRMVPASFFTMDEIDTTYSRIAEGLEIKQIALTWHQGEKVHPVAENKMHIPTKRKSIPDCRKKEYWQTCTKCPSKHYTGNCPRKAKIGYDYFI